MCGFEKIRQTLPGGELRQVVVIHQTRDNGWDGKSLIFSMPCVTAPCPTVLMVWLPSTTEFIGKTLSPIAVTRHAPVPVEILTQFEFSWVGRKRRFDKWIIRGGGGSNALLRNWRLELECVDAKQSDQQKEQENGLGYIFHM